MEGDTETFQTRPRRRQVGPLTGLRVLLQPLKVGAATPPALANEVGDNESVFQVETKSLCAHRASTSRLAWEAACVWMDLFRGTPRDPGAFLLILFTQGETRNNPRELSRREGGLLVARRNPAPVTGAVR